MIQITDKLDGKKKLRRTYEDYIPLTQETEPAEPTTEPTEEPQPTETPEEPTEVEAEEKTEENSEMS